MPSKGMDGAEIRDAGFHPWIFESQPSRRLGCQKLLCKRCRHISGRRRWEGGEPNRGLILVEPPTLIDAYPLLGGETHKETGCLYSSLPLSRITGECCCPVLEMKEQAI